MIRISEDGIYENEALASAGASFYTRNIKNDKKRIAKSREKWYNVIQSVLCSYLRKKNAENKNRARTDVSATEIRNRRSRHQ